ncbi:MAG TPA: hypothetical protein VMH20_10105 [Verrucomicrobiae bacterium]|jgi:hypothetical protein|nr:hypothetical protein [Verrucomicrobiae bacterium]
MIEQNEGVISLAGPVEKRNGQLMLLIPLAEGGVELMACSEGISEVERENLKIVIPEWLAGVLRIQEGDLVNVNNSQGKFNICAVRQRLVN